MFGTPTLPPVTPTDLATHLRSPWQPAPQSIIDPVPLGKAGIVYWLQQGAIVQLESKDIDLWRSASGDNEAKQVPNDTYLILDTMQLPNGFGPRDDITWILRKDARMPSGPLGNSRFYELSRGCIWPWYLCRREGRGS